MSAERKSSTSSMPPIKLLNGDLPTALPVPLQAGSSLSDEYHEYVRKRGCPDPPTVFNLRIGPDYKRNGRKGPTAEALYEFVTMDVFRTPNKTFHVMDKIKLPPIPKDIEGLHNGVPPYFVLNVCLPNYDPPNPIWGTSKWDGEGHSVVIYWRLKKETCEALKDLDKAHSSVRLLKRFIEEDDYKIRLKALGKWINIDGVPDMGFAARKLLTDFNQKPLLTRPQHEFHSDNRTYFEADVDVHIFNYLGRKGLCLLRPCIADMIWDFGLTVEAMTDEELPEVALGVFHMASLPLEGAPQVNFSALVPVTHSKADDASLQSESGISDMGLTSADDDAAPATEAGAAAAAPTKAAPPAEDEGESSADEFEDADDS